MKRALIIARKDIREAFQTRTTYFYILLFCFILFPYVDGLRTMLAAVVKEGATAEQIREASQAFLNTAAYTMPLFENMLIASVFTAYAVITDKAKRTLESLMVTPVSLRQVWLGKSLAVTLPCVIISTAISALAIIALDVAYVRPAAGTLVWPGALPLVSALVIVPVMVFLVVCIVTFMQLIMTNPRLATFIFTAIFLGIYASTITELTKGVPFGVVYAAATGLLAMVTVFLSRFLTKERVVMSSKV